MSFRSLTPIYETHKVVDWFKVLVDTEVFDKVIEEILSFYIISPIKILLLELFFHCALAFLFRFGPISGWYESD